MVCRPKPIRYHVRRTLQRVTVSETRMDRARYTEFMTLPPCETGGDCQSPPGESDRPCPCEDRQGRRGDAGKPTRRRLSAGDLDAGCGHGADAQARGAPLSGRPAPDPDQERGACHPACASDPEMSVVPHRVV